MSVRVRRAGQLDTRDMADLLNAIIAKGGTTALTGPLDGAVLQGWMQSAPQRSAWHVAEAETGAILGFQWIEPKAGLPPDACDIATFVRIGETGLGIGSALFEATRKAARALGYGWINARIRAENAGGLIYYQSRGFETYGRDGESILKRYDLA